MGIRSRAVFWLSTSEGGDRKLTFGIVKGRASYDVVLKHPEQHFYIRKTKDLQTESSEYIQ